MAASSLAGSWSLVLRRLEMVPRTDFSRSLTEGQEAEAARSSQLPAWKTASEGSSLRSKARTDAVLRSEEHTSELQSPCNLVCRLLLEKKTKRQHEPLAQRTIYRQSKRDDDV